MAIYKEDIAIVELNNGTIYRTFMNNAIGAADNMANRFGVKVFRNGEPENIGGTCFGLFIRQDGTTVLIENGTVNGNVAYVTLPAACYAIEGQFSLAIKCQGGGVTGTLRIVDGIVNRTSTETAVDPGTVIPSIEAIITAINEAVDSIPEEYGDLSRNFENDRLLGTTLAETGYDFEQLNDETVIINWENGAIYPVTVGEQITFGTQVTMRHFYINVVTGDIVRARFRKPTITDGSACVVFTDGNDTVVDFCEIVNGVLTQVDNTYAVPEGAEKMYIMTQDTGGTNTDYTKIFKAYSKGYTEPNNIAGEILPGYWTSADLTTRDGTAQAYRSFKQNVSAGEYTISFGATVAIIRVCINGMYCDQTIELEENGTYSFRCMSDGTVGFSFVQKNGSSETAFNTWVQLEKTGDTLGKHSTTAIDLELRKAALNGPMPLIGKTIKAKDLINGYWSGETYIKSQNRLTTFNFVPVHKGDVVVFLEKDIAAAFVVFDSTLNVITSSPYVSHGYFADNAIEADAYYFNVDGYASFNIFDREAGSSSPVSPSDYDDVLMFIDTSNRVESVTNYSGIAMLGNMKARKYNASIQGQDGTIIGNKLYSFGDGVSEPGTIDIIDLDTMENDGTGSHQLGHANSVDYDHATDTIITYGFNGTYPTIVLYQHPDFSSVLMLSDPGCVSIPLHNSGGTMNGTAAVCFGESYNIAYFMEGVYTSGTTQNPMRNIYKMLLGTGSNDLSVGGYGTFISGKSETEYNGTCKIIKKYTGEIIPGLHCFSNGNSLWTVQGMQFNGFLFVAYGTAGNNNLKIALNDSAEKYTVVGNYHFETLGSDGNIIPCEPEMLAFKNGKMYCGVQNRSSHDNYLYEIDMT